MTCSMGQDIVGCSYVDNYLTSKKILLDGEVGYYALPFWFFLYIKTHPLYVIIVPKIIAYCALIDKRGAKDLVRLLIPQKINKYQSPKFTALAKLSQCYL